MLLKIVTVAVWAAVAGAGVAHAQKISDIGGPSELPPPSYKSAQYVDSRGCVFLRAGYGGATNWVARVSSNRKVLCGYPPSLAAQRAPVAVAEAPAPNASPQPKVRAAGAPIDTIASLTTPPRIKEPAPKSRVSAQYYAPAPVANTPAPKAAPVLRQVAAAQPQAAQNAPQTAAPRATGCPANAPFAERVTLTDGRSATLCSSRAGLVSRVAAPNVGALAPPADPSPRHAAISYGAPQYQAAPRYAQAAPRYAQAPQVQASAGSAVCPASSPVARRFSTTDGGSTVLCTSASGGFSNAVAPVYAGLPSAQAGDGVASFRISSKAVPTPPKGYRLAWKDDRLNPARGQLTRPGQAAQDQLWTRDVPARLIADVPVARLRLIELGDGTEYLISTRNGHRPAGATSRRVEVRQQVVVSSKSKAKQQVVLSTKTEPSARATATGGAYVQIGTFAQPANAAGAKARLAGLGLPVAGAKISKGGKPMQIVLAGPFADGRQAQAALVAARRAGFADAFLRD